MLQIFSRSRKKRGGDVTARTGTETITKTQGTKNHITHEKSIHEKSISISKDIDKSPIRIDNRPSVYSNDYFEKHIAVDDKSASTISRIASTRVFDQQFDRGEALEYNDMDLPEEYLLAKLSFTHDEKEFF